MKYIKKEWVTESRDKLLIKHLSKVGGFSEEVSVLKMFRNYLVAHRLLNLPLKGEYLDMVDMRIEAIRSILEKVNPRPR